MTKISIIIFSLEILLTNNHFIYLLFPRSHIPSKVKTNLTLKSGIAAFFTDLATYRSNNPSSSSHLSLKQNLKSTPTVLSSIPTPVICTTYSAKCSPRAYQNTETVIRSSVVNSSIPSSTLTSKDLSNR